ncbi:glutathione S-transferase 1-like [Pectinophora gossypiella]|uniref:glutathione S-transferase 1-like n=1 Tax=Pectinophora gossypiella TaxID=13191 RepID=UPI00214DF258|nr:glutathione S-transferase 1-like [Pectinophora gossypiella]
MPPIILYSMDGSPPCRAVLMVREILGLEMNIKMTNPIAGDTQKPEFLEKNPTHSIPLIEEGDFALSDSHAIITYLVSKYGAEKRATLYPSDLRVRATVDQRLFFDASILFPRLRAVVESFVVNKAKEVSPELQAKVEEAYGMIEKYLERSPFIATDHITLADIACVATVTSMDAIAPIDPKFAKTLEWINNVKQHDWYEKGNAPGLAMFSGFVKSLIQP